MKEMVRRRSILPFLRWHLPVTLVSDWPAANRRCRATHTFQTLNIAYNRGPSTVDGLPTIMDRMLSAKFALICSILAGGVSALWPVPLRYSEGNTNVVLDTTFTIEFHGPCEYVDTSTKIWAAINRTYSLLNDGFVPDMLYPFEENFEPTEEEMDAAPRLTKLIVKQKSRNSLFSI